MYLSWWIRIRSIWYSLALHIIAAALLVFSFSFTEPIKPSHMDVSIVNAVAVDKSQVDKELQRLKQEEEKKKLEEKQRVEDLQKQTEAEKKKAEDLKKQRQEEEKKLLEAQKKKEQEQKLREEEQKKLALLAKEKEELEKQKKLEEEKKVQAEVERKKAEEEQKKKESELKKQEEERQKAEAEKKRQDAEKALQAQLDAEAAEGQRQQDLTLQQQIAREIYNKVSRNFNQTGLPEGLACTLRVRLLPGGDVVDVVVTKSSGNDIFDRRALTAVQKASPLPIPDDNAIFERLNLRDVTFTFKP
jgi:colicin import membrane protein